MKYFQKFTAITCLISGMSYAGEGGASGHEEAGAALSRYHTKATHAQISDPTFMEFVRNPAHGHIYLNLEDDVVPEDDFSRLAEVERLHGLKVGKVGGFSERIPGLGWHGGIGHAAALANLAQRLRVLDLGLSTPDMTFKLTAEGSAFLAHFVNLEELNLRNHYIREGAANLSGLIRLKRLDLYNNKIGDSVAALDALTNMEVLDLGNNGNMPLPAVQATLMLMPQLKEIDLSFCAGAATLEEWFAPRGEEKPKYSITSKFGLDFGMDYEDRRD